MVRRVKDDRERLSKESETIVHETSRRGQYLIEQVIRNMYFVWSSRARQSMMKHKYCTLDKVYMLV